MKYTTTVGWNYKEEMDSYLEEKRRTTQIYLVKIIKKK